MKQVLWRCDNSSCRWELVTKWQTELPEGWMIAEAMMQPNSMVKLELCHVCAKRVRGSPTGCSVGVDMKVMNNPVVPMKPLLLEISEEPNKRKASDSYLWDE